MTEVKFILWLDFKVFSNYLEILCQMFQHDFQTLIKHQFFHILDINNNEWIYLIRTMADKMYMITLRELPYYSHKQTQTNFINKQVI